MYKNSEMTQATIMLTNQREETDMKKLRVANNVFIVARKSPKERKLDYYMQLPNREESYLFTRKYSAECYEVCKAGTPINDLISRRKRNIALMELVKYVNYRMPYFIEYYELETVA